MMEPDLSLGNRDVPFQIISVIDWFGLRPLRSRSKTLRVCRVQRRSPTRPSRGNQSGAFLPFFTFCCWLRFIDWYEFWSTRKKKKGLCLFCFRVASEFFLWGGVGGGSVSLSLSLCVLHCACSLCLFSTNTTAPESQQSTKININIFFLLNTSVYHNRSLETGPQSSV